jgi:hypothetical protein
MVVRSKVWILEPGDVIRDSEISGTTDVGGGDSAPVSTRNRMKAASSLGPEEIGYSASS